MKKATNLLLFSLILMLFMVLPASAYSTIPSGDFDTNSSWTQSITGSGTNGHIIFYTSGSYDDSAYAYLYAKGRYSDGDLDRDYYTYTDLIQTVDVTGKDTLYFYAKYYEHDDTYSYAVGRVYVGNRSVYMDTDNVWKLYSLDVSMLEGEQELKVEAYAKGDYSWEDYATAYLYVDHFYFDNETAPTASLPLADFSMYPESGNSPLEVEFTDLSTNAVSWFWNFGDGHNSTSQNPTHTYSEAGTYTVSLRVYNSESDTSICYDSIQIYEQDDSWFPWLSDLWDWFQLIYNTLVNGFSDIGSSIVSGFTGISSDLSNATSSIGGWISGSTDSILGGLTNTTSSIGGWISGSTDSILGGLTNSTDRILSPVNGIYDFLTNTSDFSTAEAENSTLFLPVKNASESINSSVCGFFDRFASPVVNMSDSMNESASYLDSDSTEAAESAAIMDNLTSGTVSAMPSSIIWLGNIFIWLAIIGYLLRPKNS
ncbi:cell surface protein [Methanosarcina siciliae C2J]|uniref:Cell surface protein n=1 Tax=Methanosarcina siciliae C2J TaxID=1434118 RepID=A0A0E3PPQ5_9EURY|nr:PKD domain-containing protein [Methanosarcina siciliae]AKB36979.1 cell surface protein [Methanosarcina siciliae C2J]